MLCTCISLNSVRAEPSSPSRLQFWIQDAAPSTGWTCSKNPNRHPQSRKDLEFQEHWASRFHRASWVSPALALNPGLPTSRYGPPLPRLRGGGGGLWLSCNLMTCQSPSSRPIWGLSRCLAPPLHPHLLIYCLLPSPGPSLWRVYLQQPERPPYTRSLLGSVYLSTPINRLHSIWRAFALKTFPCQSLPPH